jgi:hypothetical protein
MKDRHDIWITVVALAAAAVILSWPLWIWKVV